MTQNHPAAIAAMLRLIEAHEGDPEALAGEILSRIHTAEERGKGRVRDLKDRVRILELALCRTPRSRARALRSVEQAVRWGRFKGESDEATARRALDALASAGLLRDGSIDTTNGRD